MSLSSKLHFATSSVAANAGKSVVSYSGLAEAIVAEGVRRGLVPAPMLQRLVPLMATFLAGILIDSHVSPDTVLGKIMGNVPSQIGACILKLTDEQINELLKRRPPDATLKSRETTASPAPKLLVDAIDSLTQFVAPWMKH